MKSFRNGAALGAAVIFATACAAATGGTAPGVTSWAANERPIAVEDTRTTVQVRNNNWSDMVVYAVRHSTRTRLGMVTSMGTERFTVPSGVNLTGGTLSLVASPIGSSARFSTGAIPINPGQTVELTLQNHLPISSWSVW
jgi:hypothetical protein